MRLLLSHPEVAKVSCQQCKAFVYDKDWKPTLVKGEPMPRKQGTALACFNPKHPSGKSTCPKADSPTEGERIDRLLPACAEAIHLYHLGRATAGAAVRDCDTGMVPLALAIVDREIHETDKLDLQKMIQAGTIGLMTRGRHA